MSADHDELEQGVTVWRCLQCGREAFPLRLRCPDCGSARGSRAVVEEGVLGERTVVRRAIGGRLDEPVELGTVTAGAGVVLVARLEPGLEEGDRVRLFTRGGAPIARPR